MEKDLVRRCIKGDRQAQEELYRAHARVMYNVCLAYAKDREEAKDILQEGFIKVFRNLRKYKEEGSLQAWIRRIIINVAIDHVRKQKRKIFIEMENLEEPGTGFSGIPSDMETEEIITFVRRLPEGARLIFNLFALEGYSHKEIAKKLDITEGTSKSQVSRARALLQSWMSNYTD